MPPRISEPGSAGVKEARESLNQLTDLLEKGEKKGLFSSRMPPSIERAIREENLKFMQNRDVYCQEYNKFIFDLATVNTYKGRARDQYSDLSVQSVKLSVMFLFNTYYHVKRRKRSCLTDWIEAIHSIITLSASASAWLLDFLASEEGLKYIKPYLVESTARDVRINFSGLLEKSLSTLSSHGPDTNCSVGHIIRHIVSLLSDVGDNVKNSSQYFWFLFMYAQMGSSQCQQLFDLGTFQDCFQLLTGFSLYEDAGEVDRTKQKKWTASQSREFSELFTLLAYLVHQCDTAPHLSHVRPEAGPGPRNCMVMPAPVSRLVYGPLAVTYISETLSSSREMNSTSLSLIIEMLVKISYCCYSVSMLVLEELMKLYTISNSSDLRNLSTIIVDIMTISDPIQSERLDLVIDGRADGVDGLLTLVNSCQSSDSCRAYQAVKVLVTASNKCPAVRERLIQDPTRWQHAVNWLKSKMSESVSSYWSPSSDSILSNEDSTTRTFQRTTSAQVTLDEAKAMLADFDVDKDNAMDTNNDDSFSIDTDSVDP